MSHEVETQGYLRARYGCASSNGVVEPLEPRWLLSGAPFLTDPDESHRVVVEAESYTGIDATASHAWALDTTLLDAVGTGTMFAGPDSGDRYNDSFVGSAPRLDFAVEFGAAGTYYVWTRGIGADSDGNSVHLGLNGLEQESGRRHTYQDDAAALAWSNLQMEDQPVTLNVPTAGLHTVNLWMREDGVFVDRVLLTQDALFVPTGNGPSESLRQPVPTGLSGTVWDDADGNGVRDPGEPGLAGVVVYLDGDDDAALDWTDGDGDGAWDDGEGERWLLSAADDPQTGVDEAGAYRFDGLTPGDYVVRQVEPDFARQTEPRVTPALEDIVAALDADSADVTGLIPSMFAFSGGETGNNISDGGGDMYDSGNFLRTNLASGIQYTNNTVRTGANSDPFFGVGSSYVTTKHTGLFTVTATDLDIDFFEVYGNLGADGSGSTDGAVLPITVDGQGFRVFVNRIYNAGDPSINQVVIVPEPADGVTHTFPATTNNGAHRVQGLGDTDRLHYLLFARASGGYVDNTTIEAIATQFLRTIGASEGPHRVTLGVDESVDGLDFGNQRLPAPAPGAVDLDASADSGIADDDLTNRNNDGVDRALSFTVADTIAGATVRVYADNGVDAPVLIGQALAAGTTTTVTTAGDVVLADGSWTVTATQEHPDYQPGESSASVALTLTIDTTPPVVTVDATTTDRSRPALSGTATDAHPGDVQVTVQGDAVTVTPDAAGVWSVAENTLDALPVGTYDVVASATDAAGNVGADASNNELTIVGATGSITGTVWLDTDGDGVRDAGENGVAGVVVFIDDNDDAVLDWVDADDDDAWDLGEGERFLRTLADDPGTDGVNEAGTYLFDLVSSGQHVVRHIAPLGYAQTVPDNGLVLLPTPPDAMGLDGLETTNSDAPVYALGEVVPTPQVDINTAQSGSLINLDDFLADPRFAHVDGSGYAVAVLDTGIDLDHPFFGPDADSDGVADRIVYHDDFTSADGSAQDGNGHGSNVSSIVASSDATYRGMAPGADIVALQVLASSGGGTFGQIEAALQWLVANAETYNIVAANMSLGDSANHTAEVSLHGLGDELAALESMGVILVSSSGNSFRNFNSVTGEGYPAADPAGLSVGAVYDANIGSFSYSGGATAFSTDADRLTPFSQRHPDMTTVFAPGAPITGANQSGGLVTMHGTSQAAPHIAGVAALAQQMADEVLGRRLSPEEFALLLRNSGETVNDGDDEDDNVTNTGLDWARVDMVQLAEAIDALAPGSGRYLVTLGVGDTVDNADFAHTLTTTPATETPDLLASTDTGSAADDDLTNRNNTDADTTLAFTVGDTLEGATVRLYADDGTISPILIGQATASGPTTTITTDAATTLADGAWTITATQQHPAFLPLESAISAGLTVTIDTTPPVLTVDAVTVDDLTPALLGTGDDAAVATVSVTVDGATYSADVTPNAAGPSAWDLPNGTVAALAPGDYDVVAVATDAAGNTGNDTTTDELTVVLPSASLAGTVFADPNENGTRDAGEPGIAGVIVYLDDNDNATLDWTDGDGDGAWDDGEGERWLVSFEDDPATDGVDETGNYLFGALPSGEYVVREIVPVGFVDGGQAADEVAYLRSTVGTPWSRSDNETLLTTAFGADGWDDLRYETVDVDALFSGDYGFIFMEGSDRLASELETFLDSNRSAIEAWVQGGGSLFINAAPNEGNGMTLPFGAELVYRSNTSTATVADPLHPAMVGPFTPTATSFTGNSFGHATIDWPTADPLLLNQNPSLYVAVEQSMGRGHLIYAGMTMPSFHTPPTEANNLRANLFTYGAAQGQSVVVHRVTVTAGQAIGDLDFGNVREASAVPDLAAASDTGAFDDDDLTKRNNADADSTLTFDVAGVLAGDTVELVADDGVSPAFVIGSAVAAADGTLSVTTDGATALADGTYDITARITDRYSTWPASASLSVTIDSTPPALTVDAVTVDDLTPALSGTIDDPAVATVTVTLEGTSYTADVNPGIGAGGTWMLPDGVVATLTPGTYDVAVTGTDAAGNTGADSTTDELQVVQPSAAIAGTIYADLDYDGEADPDEPGLAGVTVYLDANDNAVLDWTDGDGDGAWDEGEGERWTLTAADDPGSADVNEAGSYRFDELPSGDYAVRQVGAPDTLQQRTPSLMPVQGAKLVADDPLSSAFYGYSVGLDGPWAVAGAHNLGTGAVYVSRSEGAAWVQHTKLVPADGVSGDDFGYSVAVSGDTILVGSPLDDDRGSSSGSAYVYVWDGAAWTQQAKLTATDGVSSDLFGWDVALDGDTAVIGAYGDDDRGSSSGSAYVFVRQGSAWTQQTKLTASNGGSSDYFGYAVAVAGDLAAIGAYGEDTRGTDSGATYVFARDGSTWTQQAQVNASDGTSFDNFGIDVALSGATLLVGANGDDDNGSTSGSAYVFGWDGAGWIQRTKLTPDDGANGDEFGRSVALDGGLAVIGAYDNDDAGTESGSAYVFADRGAEWVEDFKLTANDEAGGDRFGWAVGVDGSNAIVGSYLDDDGFFSSGSAYVFRGIAGGANYLTVSAAEEATGVDFGLARSELLADLAPASDTGAFNNDNLTQRNNADTDSALTFTVPGVRAGELVQVIAEPRPVDSAAGDFDGSGSVEQGDLDVVLGNWGEPVPGGPPGATVGQAELDAVLQYWGQDADTTPNLPGPTVLASVVAQADGAVTLVTDGTVLLRDGTYDLRVRIHDGAIGLWEQPGTIAITVDTTGPTATVDALTTVITSPTLSGTFNEPLAQLRIEQYDTPGTWFNASYNNTALTWSLFANNFGPLPEGSIPVTYEATDLAGNAATATIDDAITIVPMPRFSVDSPTVTEGDDGTTTLTFTVSVTSPVVDLVRLNWSLTDGTAVAGTDYTAAATSGTLEWAAGESGSQTVSVDVVGDYEIESNETLRLNISRAAGTAEFLNTSGTGTIVNDDVESFSSTLSGTVWADDNNDGVFDAGESGQVGVVVYLDSDNDGVLDWADGNGDGAWDNGEGERWVVTAADDPATTDEDEAGTYRFDFLPAGEYRLRAVTPTDYAPSFPGRAVPGATLSVAVFDDAFYVSTGGGQFEESDTVQATLSSLGFDVLPFTGVTADDFRDALADANVLLIPELDRRSLWPDLGAEAQVVIRDYVEAGGGLIVMSEPSNSTILLNGLFGTSMTMSSSGTSFKRSGAVGTEFEDDLATLPSYTSNFGIRLTSLPADAVTVYDDNSDATVVLLPQGDGTAAHISWDWYRAAPLGSLDGGWHQVLESAVIETAGPVDASHRVELGANQTLGGFDFGNWLVPDFAVESATPADGAVLNTAPTTATIDFNVPVDTESLDAADLTVDGVAATAVRRIDADSVAFDFAAPIADGSYTVAIAEGAILDFIGRGVPAFSSVFTLDTVGPRVLSSSITPDTTLDVSADSFTWNVRFDGPIDFDLSKMRATLTAADTRTFMPPETVYAMAYEPATHTATFVFDMTEQEGAYRVSLNSGDFRDPAGNALDGEATWPLPAEGSGDGVPGGNFLVNIAADRVAVQDVDGLVRRLPLGSLVSETEAIYGVIAEDTVAPTPTDTDTFRVTVDAGQSVSAVFTPLSIEPGVPPTMRLTVTVAGTDYTAPAGEAVVVNLPAAGADGDVDFTVTSDLPGDYSVTVYLNTLVEVDDDQTPVSIDGSALPLADGVRWAVRGTLDADDTSDTDDFVAAIDYLNPGPSYVLSGSIGQTFRAPTANIGVVRVAMQSLGVSTVTARLRGGSINGQVLAELTSVAVPASGASWVELDFNNIAVPAGETYAVELIREPGSGTIQFFLLDAAEEYADGIGIHPTVGGDADLAFAVGAYEPSAGDTFRIDLSDRVGQSLDVIYHRVDGVADPATPDVLELIGPDGSTLLATATPDPLDGDATNFDLGILDFAVAEAGVYTLRLRGAVPGAYQLVATAGLKLPVAPNGGDDEPLRSLGDGEAALGYVAEAGDNRVFALRSTFNQAPDQVVEVDPETGVATRVLLHLNSRELSISDIAYDGSLLYGLGRDFSGTGGGAPTVFVTIEPDTGDILSTMPITGDVGLTSLRGMGFFEDSLVLGSTSSGDLYFLEPQTAAVQRTLAGAFPSEFPTDLVGAPDRGSVFVLSPSGELVYEVDATTGVLQGTITVGAVGGQQIRLDGLAWDGTQLLGSARLEQGGSGDVSFVTLDPDSGAVTSSVTTAYPRFQQLASNGSAEMPWATPNVGDPLLPGGDAYTVTLAAGDAVNFTTSTPFDAAGALPGNTLDPVVVLYGPDGSVVGFNENGGADGRNAALNFTATDAGQYTVQVLAQTGRGEFTLSMDLADSPGDTAGWLNAAPEEPVSQGHLDAVLGRWGG